MKNSVTRETDNSQLVALHGKNNTFKAGPTFVNAGPAGDTTKFSSSVEMETTEPSLGLHTHHYLLAKCNTACAWPTSKTH